jgi:hypothetical protein
LRLERQYVPQGKDRKPPADLAASDLHGLFLGGWSLWTGGEPLTVLGENAAERHLLNLLRAEKLKTPTAMRLLGAVAAKRAGVWSDLTELDAGAVDGLTRDLRRAGVAFARAMNPDTTVLVGPLLTAAASPWPTGSVR